MKLLHAMCCETIVVPNSEPFKENWCKCLKSCCWWENPWAGTFGCFSYNGISKVAILGLHNGLLVAHFPVFDKEYGCIQGSDIKAIITNTPDNFIFKQVNSLVVRFRPGFSNDTFIVDHVDKVGKKR